MAKDEYPICPVCGEECDTVYKDLNGIILGCGECVDYADAWTEDACFHKEAY